MKKVIVIVGPTASGKTEKSINLAKEINAEIINGDSVQVYKELNIGSAKITDDEKDGVIHHLFDVVNVGEEYTVFNFQKDSRKLIDKIDVPIIVGGTGFYIKAALYNYEFKKEENISYDIYNKYSNDELYKLAKEADNDIKLDKNNRHRLIRTIHLSKTNQKRSEKTKKDEPLYDILTFYLDINRNKLKEILIKRLDIMLENGFLEEVEYIRSKNIKLNIIGYRELDMYLNNEITLNEAKELIINASMKLAKRQKTWFKNQMNTIMIDTLSKDANNIILNKTREFLKNE